MLKKGLEEQNFTVVIKTYNPDIFKVLPNEDFMNDKDFKKDNGDVFNREKWNLQEHEEISQRKAPIKQKTGKTKQFNYHDFKKCSFFLIPHFLEL